MALKGARRVVDSEIRYYMNEVAERGGVAVISTGGSGAAYDQGQQLCTYSANPSGKKPVGVLACDMVNYNLARQKLNELKDEVQKGGKVTLITKGFVVTNMVMPGQTIVAGQDAYLGNSGYFSNTSLGTVQGPWVGRFDTAKDEDGYVSVSINLPNQL